MAFSIILLLVGVAMFFLTLVRLGGIPDGMQKFYKTAPEYRRLWIGGGLILLALWRMLG